MAEQKRESIVRWAQVGATLFLGVVGLVFTYVTNLQQEENRNNQMAVQIMSQREQAKIEFPADYVTTGYRPSIKEANRMFKNIQ